MKNIIMALLLVTAIFASGFVLAEENLSVNASSNISVDTENSSDSINVSADEQVPSKFRYGWEKFRLHLMWNETNKLQHEFKLAKWKLQEAKFEAKKGNFEAADSALEEQESILENIRLRVSKFNETNRTLTPGLDQSISVHEERLANLKLLLESSNLTDEQKIKLEMRISRLENNTQHLQDVRDKVREKREDKLQERLNKTLDKADERREKLRERMNQTNNETEDDSQEDNSSDDDSDENESDDDSSSDDSDSDDEETDDDSTNVSLNVSGSVNI
jgi:chromosome segregation ATPase